MHKIAITLFALFVMTPALSFAQTGTTTSTTTPATINVACVQNAIEKRDGALISAHDAFNTAIKNALMARKDALKSAWAQVDKTVRKTAQKEAWTTFQTTQKNAHNALRTSRVTAWNTFSSEMKTCGVKEHGENALSPKLPTSAL